jgi:hypothetical protein
LVWLILRRNAKRKNTEMISDFISGHKNNRLAHTSLIRKYFNCQIYVNLNAIV